MSRRGSFFEDLIGHITLIHHLIVLVLPHERRCKLCRGLRRRDSGVLTAEAFSDPVAVWMTVEARVELPECGGW